MTDSYSPADDIAEAFRRALAYCDEHPSEVQPGVFAGENLPELIRAGLEIVAAEQSPVEGRKPFPVMGADGQVIEQEPNDGRIEALMRHRPGSWEAELIRQLVVFIP